MLTTRPPSAGTGETPTLGTLDFYMARLHGAIERDPAQHERLIVRIKEILAQVARCVPSAVAWSPLSHQWGAWGLLEGLEGSGLLGWGPLVSTGPQTQDRSQLPRLAGLHLGPAWRSWGRGPWVSGTGPEP